MCRIIIVHGKGELVSQIYSEVFESLIKASKNDPYLAKLFDKEEASHKDGWGRLNINIYQRKISLTVHKSIRPIYLETPSTMPIIYPKEVPSREDYVIDFVHARAKSRGMPRNIFSVHPLESITKNGYRLFLIHNGSVYKEKIIEDMTFKMNNKYKELYTDSYFLSMYLANIIEDEIDEHVIRKAAEYTKTALNIGLVLMTNDYLYIATGSFYKEGDKPIERKNYYKMYRYAEDDMVVYVSSTIVDFEEYKPKTISSWTEVENGYFEIYRINYKEKETRAIKVKEFKI